MLKKVGDRRLPCLTSTVVLNHSPMLASVACQRGAQWCELDMH